MTRDEIRNRIDKLECLSGVLSAIEDVRGVEFFPGECHVLRLAVTDKDGLAVSSVSDLPPEVLITGLSAMKSALEKMTNEAVLADEHYTEVM